MSGKNLNKTTKRKRQAKNTSTPLNTSKPQGLGDIVEKVTEATGIKKVVEFVAGKDCGCDERKKTLNRLYPRKGVQCLTEEEHTYIQSKMPLYETITKMSNRDPIPMELYTIHFRVFGTFKRLPSSCGQCWKTITKELTEVYNTYEG